MAGSAWTNQVQNQVIIAGASGQLLAYSGKPAANNLVASISAVNTTDPYGNKVLAGFTIYITGAVYYALNLTGISPNLGTIQQFQAVSQTAGWGTAVELMQLTPGTLTVQGLLQLGITGAQGELAMLGPSGAVNTTFVTTASGTLQESLPSGLTGTLDITQTDNTQITVTAASITAITKAWPIPIGDAQVGTVYRIKAFGTGTQGSTQQNLSVDGNNGHPSLQVAGTIIGISQAFSWQAEAEMRVTATGVSGTADVKIAFTWQANATGTTSNTWSGVQASTAVTFNTTIAQTLQIRMNWASTTGAPTVTCYGSTLERLGL